MRYYKILFLISVFFLLIIPLFHMNTAKISEQENRTLAKFPEIKKNEKINTDFGKEFESWLGDRFWGRSELINARFQTLYKINGRIENEQAFIGDDGWMFEKSKTANIPSIEKQRKKIENDAEILKSFAYRLKNRNIPIYLVIIPDREQLYQKYWERYYKPKPKLDYGEEIITLLKDYPNIKIIYPKKEFETGTKVYFHKDDMHLNGNGSELLAQSVLKFLKIDDKDYIVKQQEGSSIFHIAAELGFKNVVYPDTKKELRVAHRKAKYKRSTTPSENFNLNMLYETGFSTRPVINEKLYLLGSCYSRDSLFPFLKYAYQEIERVTVYPHDHSENLYNFRLEKIKNIYRDRGKFSIMIISANLSYKEIKIIADSLSD